MIWYFLAFIILVFAWPWLGAMFSTSQVFGAILYRKKTAEKVLALSFDDGPNPPYTNKLLEILNKHGVRATFFVVGKNLLANPEIGRELVAAGHVIANHSYGHDYWKYFVQPTYTKEIAATQNLIKQVTGKSPKLFRPPWLYRQPWFLNSVRKAGLEPISGIFGYEFELFQPSAQRIASKAISKAYPGCILIFHDGFGAGSGDRSETVSAVDLLIPKLKQQGYRFETVDNLLNIPAYQT